MTQVQIGENIYEAVVTRQKDNLSITMEIDRTLEELEDEFAPDKCPEIRVFKKDGPTQAIYKNHAVTGQMLRKDSAGTLRMTVTMRVEQVTQAEGEALREEIENQKKIIAQFSQEMESNRNTIMQAEKTMNETLAILEAIKEGIANA